MVQSILNELKELEKEKNYVKRYWVNMTMEIFVPEQGCGEKAY